MVNVAEKWAEVLGRIGVRYVFGIPSGPWMAYMEALRGSDVEFVLVSNEASAGFMADVCGRITGIPGACYGTFGPGATNLSTGVGGALLDRSPLLAFTHEMSDSMATDLILQSRERATITLSTESDDDDVEKLIRQLRENGRLTPSIILRALCMGDLNFFETAVCALAEVPLVNGRQLMHDSGALGLKALYEKTGLPESHFPAVRAAIDVARETEYDGRENDRERYSRRMIERILTQYGDLGVDFDSDDLEYLLAKMNELPVEIADTA